jgi:Cu-Zn family superoxide dismutase
MASAFASLRKTNLRGLGKKVGIVEFQDTPYGLLIETILYDLPPGIHGLHVHAGTSCGPGPNADGKVIPGGAAKGHLDPTNRGKHLGPYRDGHLGDLPRVTVYADGTSDEILLAPRVRVRDILGRVLMFHAGGDTYSDTPHLGGGGARVACGVIQR